MGKKDKQNAAESTPEKNTAQQPTADEAAKTAETAKADETAEKSAEPETFTVARKKDGEIVGTFKSRELAEAVIEKAKKAKKASLVLV